MMNFYIHVNKQVDYPFLVYVKKLYFVHLLKWQHNVQLNQNIEIEF
ncbi:unnamed protein product [Schistosoma curassoni]|uniref:Uncharacterized protein n=1 Tax=Schistosoma curassoni TaxID=6186 RepID=A0A183KSI9_9TREM|nr:unnamed protein product [Schistosoma curassoni]